jgi:hypothetical protein
VLGTQYILTVPGRTSGKLYSTPVSLLTVDGQRYIVSLPWTGWVKNARVADLTAFEQAASQLAAFRIESEY